MIFKKKVKILNQDPYIYSESMQPIEKSEVPHGLKAFKQWFRIHITGELSILRIVSKSDDPYFEYEEIERVVYTSQIPSAAKHCRGESHYYSLMAFDQRPCGHDPDGYDGHAAWGLMKSGAFDPYSALMSIWKTGDHVPLKKVLIIVGVLIVGCIGLMLIMNGGR